MQDEDDSTEAAASFSRISTPESYLVLLAVKLFWKSVQIEFVAILLHLPDIQLSRVSAGKEKEPATTVVVTSPVMPLNGQF